MRVEYTQRIRNGEVKARRLALGLSQKQLGEKIGYSVAAISHIEAFRSRLVGQPILEALSRFFCVPVDTLYPSWLFEVAQIPVEVTTNLEVDQVAFERLSQSAINRISCVSQPALELAIAREEVDLVLAAFAKLPKRQAMMLKLFCEGYSYRQIAKRVRRSSQAGILENVRLATLAILRTVPDLKEYSQGQLTSLLRYGLGRDVSKRSNLRKAHYRQNELTKNGYMAAEHEATYIPRIPLRDLIFRALQKAGCPLSRQELADHVQELGYTNRRCNSHGRLLDLISYAAHNDPRIKAERRGARSIYSLR